ncbi:MAG: NAD-dependent protein deacetylase, SIR2 family [Lachnospiraceae bacterium]|nr:NAD-dependent protein deacetylase, SIR2 family [Lachnospiraceae bacterium]
MKEYLDIAEKIRNSDAVLVGASNGFSISEGLHLFADNQAFEEVFGDFKRKYGIRSILQGCFTQFPSEEEKWAFYSRLVNHYSGNYSGSANTDALKKMIGNKPYFMVTSNGENHFELAGFDPVNIFEIEGSWKDMQCENRCCDALYPAFELIKEMGEKEKDGKIPMQLVPKCPHCGGTMMLHWAGNNAFIPDTKAAKQFQKFIDTWHNKRIVVLELGIGWRNQLIKEPLMRLVAQEQNAIYVTINKGEIYITDEIKEKSFGFDGDITEVLQRLAEANERVGRI